MEPEYAGAESRGAEQPAEMDNDKPEDDCVCMICYEILLDPVTLYCGHTFCQLCVAKLSWKNGVPQAFQCPLCKQLCQSTSAVNIQLRSIIENRYARLANQRRSALTEEDKMLLDLVLKSKQTGNHPANRPGDNLPNSPPDNHHNNYPGNNRGNRRSNHPDNHPANRPDNRYDNSPLSNFLGLLGKILGYSIKNPNSPFSMVIFCIIITLLLVICMAVVALVSALSKINNIYSGTFLTKPVNQWETLDVADWVDGLGDWAHQYKEVFIRHKINGPRLLLLHDEKDLHTLGIEHEFSSTGFLEAIEELRQHEFYSPHNFQEYKAAHQIQVLTLALCYKLWPRLTFLSVYLLNYHDVFVPVLQHQFLALIGTRFPESEQHLESQTHPGNSETGMEATQLEEVTNAAINEGKTKEDDMTTGQRLVSLLAILVIPHVLVGCYAWSWVGVHYFTCTAIIVHCIVSSWRDLKVFNEVIQPRAMVIPSTTILLKFLCRLLAELFYSTCLFAVTFLVMSAVWLFTPSFFYDALFYLILWHTVFKSLFHILV